jgi:MIF4G domain
LTKSKAISDNESALLLKSLKEFYASALVYINDLHTVIYNQKCKQVELTSQKIKEELCLIDEARVNEGYNLRNELNKSREAIIVLSDILNLPVPVFEEEENAPVPEDYKHINPAEIFDFDEDRDFYLNFPAIEENKEHNYIQDKFEGFKKKLHQCSSKEIADQLAEEFVKIANKKHRKDLVDTLCLYSKHTQQFLPFYSRMIAGIATQHKEVPNKILSKLETEFKAFQEQGDPSTLDIRVRNLKFIAELVKFQLAQPQILLNCFELCLHNFSGENIEIACQLLRSCGRYLSKHPASSETANLMINRMVRIKDRKNLPPETENSIDEVIFICRPKEKTQKKKNSPVLYQFIKYQFLSLNSENIEGTVKILQSCPIPESEIYIIDSIFKSVKKGTVSNLQNISKVLLALKKNAFFCETVVFLVDTLCEDVLFELKNNDFRKSQYRILMIKFFGELYCCDIIDYNLVFKMLFTLLCFDTDPFKVKLIWTLLDTVKDRLTSFSAPNHKNILTGFLTEFKKYILSKPGISIELEFLVMDLFEMFRLYKLKPTQSVNFIKDNLDYEENKYQFESSSSEGENTFDKEFDKIIEEEISLSKNNEVVREKDVPTIYGDGSYSGFKLLVKKAGKIQAKPIDLPKNNPLVLCSEERSKTQAAEREKLSKVVVDLHYRRLQDESK